MKTSSPLTLKTWKGNSISVELEMNYDEKYKRDVLFLNSRNGNSIGNIIDAKNGIVEIDCAAFVKNNNFYSLKEWEQRGMPAVGTIQLQADESENLQLKIEMMSDRLFQARTAL